MKLHYEQSCSNSIDLIDDIGNIIGSIDSGDKDIMDHEIEIAELICNSFNDSIESENF